MNYHAIVEAANRILSEYSYPLTLRQIYYRLVSNGVIANKRSAYNGLSNQLVKARENGEVDDSKIEDRSRSVIASVQGYESANQFRRVVENWIHGLGENYYADLWASQDVYVEVWVEKDALSQVIARAAEPFRITVCPSRGYSSYSYIKRVAIDGRFSSIDKPIVVLDFRDHDPSGIQMTEDLQRRLNKYGGVDFGNFGKEFGLDFKGIWGDLFRSSDIPAEITEKYGIKSIMVQRIALTISQVREYNLIPNPTKQADPRSPKYVAEFGDECWELDAIPPDDLQSLVTSSIEQYIDRDRWNKALEQEEKDRGDLKERFANADLDLGDKSS